RRLVVAVVLSATVSTCAAIAAKSSSASYATTDDRPVISEGPRVSAATFRRDLRRVPHTQPAERRVFPRPLAADEDHPPDPNGAAPKTPLAGAQEPPAGPPGVNVPAPGPGQGGDAFSGSFAGLDFVNWGAGWPPG